MIAGTLSGAAAILSQQAAGSVSCGGAVCSSGSTSIVFSRLRGQDLLPVRAGFFLDKAPGTWGRGAIR